MKISIVSPVYKAEKIVDELVRRLVSELTRITDDFEIVLVDDCGPDRSWEKIKENCAREPRVRGIRLSRNFGQHYAITAGLDHCTGEWIVVMDCDLQDRPEEIVNLYNEAMKGYDIVFARRVERQDGFFKKLGSRLFYKAFSYLSGIPQDGTIANFGIYQRKVIDAINAMREPMRGFTAMARWVGFSKTSIDVQHAERFEGTTSYNWKKLINLALDISLAYSDKPLRIMLKLGLLISTVSFIVALYYIIAYFLGIITLTGFTSLIVSIWFLAGVLISILGVLGLYIGKIFDGIKNRPLYLIKESVN